MTRLLSRVEEGKPGLFVNPDWQPGTPGTFAVIIGVSEYPYLEGGSEFREGDDAFTLGQLHVSAATARAFFQWLAEWYDYPPAPPAQCWLLLSPTVSELQAFGDAAVDDLVAAPATLTNCELAIQSWYEAMTQLTARAGATSRSLFFFTGHGLEVWQDHQILLPSDYLRRPGRSVNDAISTANLLKGLASSTVTNHFLFADACRNDVPQLREYVVEGRQILNVRSAAATNPDAFTGILYASASGTETWQPRELEQGLSLFGDALVHGLRGVEGIERHGCDGHHCEIQFPPLKAFVNARMAQLLNEFSSPEKARVRQGGSPPDGGITLVPDVAAPAPAPGPAPASLASLLADRYQVVHTNLAWTPGRYDPTVPGQFREAHEIFGSERMIEIWADSARAHDLATGDEVPREEIVIRQVRRSKDTKAFRISVQLPSSRHGHWLSFTDPRGQRFASSLAVDARERAPVYELTIDFELEPEHPVDSSSRSVSTVEVRLSPLNRGRLGRIAEIWDAYETQNAAVAVGELPDPLLPEIVSGYDGWLPATVASLLLIRARRLVVLPDWWPWPLSDLFPDNPDVSVLRVEQQRLKADEESQHAVALEQLSRLAEQGLPRLAELLPMAWRQLTELPEQTDAPWRLDLQDQVRTAMRYHRPGGLFAVYASPTDPFETLARRVSPATPG
jgi:hypothetical protein